MSVFYLLLGFRIQAILDDMKLGSTQFKDRVYDQKQHFRYMQCGTCNYKLESYL